MAVFDSFLTDKHLLNLYAFPAQPQLTTMATDNPSLLYFLDSVPSPITLLLVDLAPLIHFVRRFAEIVSWKSYWAESWLAIAAWWYLCLTAYTTFRYLLPLLVILPSVLSYLPILSTRRARLTTEQVLTAALSDIHAFRALLPASPQLPSCLKHVNLAIRLSAILCIPYIFIAYLIPFPVVMSVVGTFVLSCRAPWAQALYSILTRSAYVRWAFSHVWRILSGTTLDKLSVMSTTPHRGPASPVQFLFTILECQRWWVGLDWTAALLPGERPSWCTVSYQAITPPSVFVLPPATSVFLPGQNNKRTKHTAIWRWADSEWGVLINKDGTGVKRVEKQPPGVTEDDEKDAGSRLKRAATMLKDRTSAMSNVQDKDKKENESSAPAAIPDAEGTPTDVDGWVYGDNKWEAPSSKGGLGKYTRFRRWTRVATLEETVEVVGPGPLGLVKDVVSSSPNIGYRDAKSIIKDAYPLSDLKVRNSVSPSPSPGPDTPTSNLTDSIKIPVELTPGSPSSMGLHTGAIPSPKGLSNNKDLNKLDQNYSSKSPEDLANSFRERLKSVVRNTTRFE